MILRTIGAAALLIATAAQAQVVSYSSNRPDPVKGDANKVVCQRTETLGTRLGAKKTCMTVAEWQARQRADRIQTEKVQSDTRAMRSGG